MRKLTEKEEVELFERMFTPMGEYKSYSRSAGDIHDSHIKPLSTEVAHLSPEAENALQQAIKAKKKECNNYPPRLC